MWGYFLALLVIEQCNYGEEEASYCQT